MKLDPRHLEVLAAIVENGGLTEGAEALGRSQPSVSRTLALLEARLGTNLFEKGKRPLRPTEMCHALAAEGNKIIEANRNASELASGFKDGRAGIVRVGGTPIFMDGVISGIIADFQMSYPKIRIHQSHDYMTELMRQLETGSLDIAICPLSLQNVPQGFECIPILPGRNVIACANTHPLAPKSSIKLSDIAQYSWITPPVDSPLYEDIRNVLSSIGMRDFKVSFSGGSLASVVNILERSDALTVLPYSVVFMLRRQNRLQALPIKIGHPERSLSLLWTSDTALRPTVQRFSNFIEKEFATLASAIIKQEQNALWRA